MKGWQRENGSEPRQRTCRKKGTKQWEVKNKQKQNKTKQHKRQKKQTKQKKKVESIENMHHKRNQEFKMKRDHRLGMQWVEQISWSSCPFYVKK